jgi:hypothetical protein
MAQTFPLDISSGSAEETRIRSRAAAITWDVWAGLIAVTSITFGLYWDISWHMTIGRDTFWTPAHLAIHFGGILAAVTCMYLIFSTTFAHDAAARDASVRVWGFRGPLGAFFTAWGGVMMLTSAPFDNWWHNSFGLDIEILSPPHFVLGLGINGVVLGSTLLVISRMNRAEGIARDKLVRILLYLAGLQLVLHMMLIYEYSEASLMHSAIFYRTMTIGVPLILTAFGRASGHRWGSTIVAAVYSIWMCATLWIFPLFPATPKLGPGFTPVTHMLPLGFPMLLIVPALLLDLTFRRTAGRNRWLQAAIAGTIFLAALILAQWTFADLLISPLGRTRFFGEAYLPYFLPPSRYFLLFEFRKLDPTPAIFLARMSIAWISAIISTRIGITIGDALKRLRR